MGGLGHVQGLVDLRGDRLNLRAELLLNLVQVEAVVVPAEGSGGRVAGPGGGGVAQISTTSKRDNSWREEQVAPSINRKTSGRCSHAS